MSFNAEEILSAQVSEDAAKGKRPITPEGSYNNCVITSVQAFEPFEDQEGVKARLQVRYECPDHAEPLQSYINVSNPTDPHPMSAHFQLIAAIWPDAKERANKSINDWVGEKINIMVVHQPNQNGDPWAKYNFRPVK